MCSRLMALGLTKTESTQLLDKLEVWIEHSGEEWTVEHLKEVKLLYLHKLAGTSFRPKHWIAQDVNGIPKGPLKALFNMSSKNLSRVLTAFTSYSASLSVRMTKKQEKKFFSSMMSSDKRGMDSRLKIVISPIDKGPSATPTILQYCSSPNKRGPNHLGRTSPETDVLAMLLHGAGSLAVRRVVEMNKNVFEKVIPFELFCSLRPPDWTSKNGCVDTFGTISGIQEPGFKLRAVANPSRIIQAALEPLKSALADVLKSTQEDFTHDQRRAIPVIQRWLSERRTVYSVDLSDATNLFPWPLQRELLKETFTHPYYQQLIDIMDVVSTGPWLTHLKGDPEVVRFTRGQPLGLGPSFHTFAYSHNTLLKGICEKNGLEPRYCVLGDDVVIADSQLHRIYRATLDNLGCRVSESKTFSSKVMAEFAGTTVLANRSGHGYKWRQMSDFSFIDAARNLGKPALGMMNPLQRQVTLLLSQLPKGIGGVGWSDGLKLSDLDSPIYNYAVKHLVGKESEQPVMYRDLVADTIRLCERISRSEFQSPMFRVTIPGEDKILVSDLIRNDVFRDVGKYSKLRPEYIINDGDRGPLPPGYYPVVSRLGDPRPSVLPLVREIIHSAKADNVLLEKQVIKWAKSQKGIKRPKAPTHSLSGMEDIARKFGLDISYAEAKSKAISGISDKPKRRKGPRLG